MADAEKNSIFDTEPDEVFEARLDAEAKADYKAGRVIPHERVRKWLLALSTGENVAPPEV